MLLLYSEYAITFLLVMYKSQGRFGDKDASKTILFFYRWAKSRGDSLLLRPICVTTPGKMLLKGGKILMKLLGKQSLNPSEKRRAGKEGRELNQNKMKRSSFTCKSCIPLTIMMYLTWTTPLTRYSYNQCDAVLYAETANPIQDGV